MTSTHAPVDSSVDSSAPTASPGVEPGPPRRLASRALPQRGGPVRVVRPRPIDLRRLDGGPLEPLLPNLMLAGVTHAGASELARMLARHPEVKRPVVKRIDLYDPLRYDHPVVGSLADYDRHFATWTGQQYRLERSATYFDGGPDLVRTVARDLPDLRVLIVLRDPVQRLWAGFQDKIASGRLPQVLSYPAYVERCLALRANGADRFEGNRYFRTLSSGLYAEHLGPWLELFGPRLRVVFTDHLDHDPESVLAGVHTWLGLEPVPLARTGEGSGYGRRGQAGLNGLQSFDSPPEGGAVRRLSGAVRPSVDRLGLDRVRHPVLAGRSLAHRVADATGRRHGQVPRTPADRLYQRANRELADQLRAAGCRDLPAWLGR